MCSDDHAVFLSSDSRSRRGGGQTGFHRFQLGGTTITALCDGHFALSVQEVLRDGETPMQPLLERARVGAVVSSHVNAFLIELGTHRMLIDAGAGDLQDATLGDMSAQLMAAGLRPEQIDTVLVTHLHPDHIGGLTRNGVAVFPHAVIHVPREEDAFWLGAGDPATVDASVRATFEHARQILAPYRAEGRYRLFDSGAVWNGCVTAESLSGHTGGHVGYRLHTDEGDVAFCGDLFHVAAVQLADPDVTVCYDSEPAKARTTRAAFLADACRRNDIVAAAHAPFPGLGRIVAADNGYAWHPVA
jgi:glyoxylase-like metal-dependent hydrolase (beta-lactamase superfamily II)